jgi:hypothetical protein
VPFAGNFGNAPKNYIGPDLQAYWLVSWTPVAELPACHLYTKSWYRYTPTLPLVFFLIEVLASIVIIFDKVSEGRSERNDGNPARIIPTISSFIPGVEESLGLSDLAIGRILR